MERQENEENLTTLSSGPPNTVLCYRLPIIISSINNNNNNNNNTTNNNNLSNGLVSKHIVRICWLLNPMKLEFLELKTTVITLKIIVDIIVIVLKSLSS